MRITPIRQRHLCSHCQLQKASFTSVGNRHFRARKDHDLCSRCFRRLKATFRRWCRENTLDGWLM
jgi:hypothetical protein